MQCDILRYGTFHLCNFNSVHMGKVFWLGVFSKADQSGFVSKSEFVTSAGYIYFLNMSSWIFNRLISFLVNFIGRLSITCDPSLRQEGPMVVLQGQSVNILWRIGPPTSSDLSLWCPFCSQTVDEFIIRHVILVLFNSLSWNPDISLRIFLRFLYDCVHILVYWWIE